MHDLGFWITLAFVGLIATIFIGFSILLIIVALFEKHPIRSLVPIPDTEPPQLSPYAQAMNDQVRQDGFTYVGYYAPSKGGIYKTITTVWLSPDRTTRVTVTGGTTARIKVRRTNLTSRTSEGVTLMTTDEFGEKDLSGQTDAFTLINAHFPELWHSHQFRLSRAPGLLHQYGTDVPEERQRELERQAARLVEMKLARYTDPNRSAWCYTPRGAFAFWRHGFLRQMSDAQAQRDRRHIPRPGAAEAPMQDVMPADRPPVIE